MSLVNKFHSGLLNLHNDILLQMCNKIDEQCQTYKIDKIDKIDKIPNVLLQQQLEDRLNTLEKRCTGINVTIESILARLNNIESNHMNNSGGSNGSGGLDITSEIIKRLQTLESSVECSTGASIGYSRFVCDKQTERVRPTIKE
jgi:hypothetical protein